jgi:predicted CXXCH cytochrome family protein
MSLGHSKSESGPGGYERPDCRYRCGRGAAWSQPCSTGPSMAGQCGGTHECTPQAKDGQFICRRPREAGGPCANGPGPDGTCSQTHPPCIPRLTLRARRGRLVWQALIFTALVLAAGFHFGSRGRGRPLAVDPGPLSAAHASFAGETGCATCHAPHETGLGGMLRAAFTAHDMSAQCLECHQFDGPARSPHNETFTPHHGPAETDCRQCHVEHRGLQVSLTSLTDAQCHTCHQAKFDSFTHGHPEFPAGFPVASRGTIKFNHAKHLLDYFQQPAYAERARADCTACHVATPREPDLRTLGFTAACAACHEEQIRQSELTLLRLPEPLPPEELFGDEDATPFMAWLLQRYGPAEAEYGQRAQAFLGELAADGLAPLRHELTNAGASGPAVLAGLHPDLLTRAAAAWRAGMQYEPATAKPVSGWYWFEDLYPELRYQPAGHADPVARAWLEFALAAAAGETDPASARLAGSFRDEVAHLRSGVGRCAKCHAISAGASQPLARRVEWHYRGAEPRAHTRFSHGAHLGLRQCADCHDLNARADYEAQFADFTHTSGASSFHAIQHASCVSCHAEGKVRADCRLCHEYHRTPGLREVSVIRTVLEPPKPGGP